MAADRLLVFLRAPRLGTVKTRLAAALGDAGALAAYRELLAATLAAVVELDEVELRFTPDDAGPELAAWGRPDWPRRPQGDGDLGAKLARAFANAFAAGAGAGRVAVIGADCPALTAADIRAAWAALDQADVVLGPAPDGGYWLMALGAPRPGLFAGIAWGGPAVLAETEQRAAAAGLRVHRLRELADVDTPADWHRHQNSRFPIPNSQ